MQHLIIGDHPLTIEEVVQVARNGTSVSLSQQAKDRIDQSAETVAEFIRQERTIYGITTGFGKFSDVRISSEELTQLQHNLIISHSSGVGDSLADDEIRAVILLRINALSFGYSGIRLETIEQLIGLLNDNILPWIPQRGSLGASGDLAPLAHMVSPLLGQGKCKYQGEWIEASDMLRRTNRKPYELAAKEGLALINGTQVMTAVGLLAYYDAERLFHNHLRIAGITMEALRGIRDVFDERLHRIRPHVGQISVAQSFRQILHDSDLMTDQGELRVQDAYSLRCMPQVLGATLDTLEFVKSKLEIEINSVTDNPIIFGDDMTAISGGNFHGQPMALVFDYLGIAMSELANIAERRIERLVNPALSGLPAFLTVHGGLHSGFMIAQYSAAALVSENKVLAHPASVDSIPSSANQEDHVSMGTIAARKARDIIRNAEYVIAIEFLCSCQAIDLIEGNNKMAGETRKVYDHLRNQVPRLVNDRFLATDIEKARDLVCQTRF